MGTSIESDDYSFRIGHLRNSGARIKFLSLEPLLGRLKGLDLRGIDWVIIGGESGPGARPVHPDWVREIRDQCLEQAVPFFLKSWGGVVKKRGGRKLDGRIWEQFPQLQH
jgi:protein gp37